LLGRPWFAGRSVITGTHGALRNRNAPAQRRFQKILALSASYAQDFHPMRRNEFFEAKKKLWRPCREARAQGL
jgi:hypothetical protein